MPGWYRPGKPRRDLDLAALYAGYAASGRAGPAARRGDGTQPAFETIMEALQTLAGPALAEAAPRIALQTLRHGLGADEVTLVAATPDGAVRCRGVYIRRLRARLYVRAGRR